MNSYYSDTDIKVAELQMKLLRGAAPWKKMEMLAGLNYVARHLALQGLRARHPKANDPELKRRLAGLLLGEELATRVYGELKDGA